eukprot:ANDGO_04893.mRNA.1 Transcription initiation factor TFIID subunit 5
MAQNSETERNLEQTVFQYLRERGYSKTAEALKVEAKALSYDEFVNAAAPAEMRARLQQHLMLFTTRPAAEKYDESFCALRDWIASAIDVYQAELVVVLYPLFVHCFLDMIRRDYSDLARNFLMKHARAFQKFHKDEIRDLEMVLLPEHFSSSLTAKKMLDKRVAVRLCDYSFESLFFFLHESDSFLMMSLLNNHFAFKVYAGAPDFHHSLSIAAVTAPTAKEEEGMGEALRWDPVDFEGTVREKWTAAQEALQQQQSGTAAPAPKKIKKEQDADKTTGASTQLFAAFGSTGVARSTPASLFMKDSSLYALFKELEAKMKVSKSSLPSACFFTLLNSANRLTCSASSLMGNVLAAGFSDSTVKIWELKYRTSAAEDAIAAIHTAAQTGQVAKNAQQNLQKAQQANVKPSMQSQAQLQQQQLQQSSKAGSAAAQTQDSIMSDYSCLVGHAGPVYSLSFSPDGRYLLSASEDGTVRLWAMLTHRNMVVYRGHGYPVFDVCFSPLGYYFATASADRTARLWCTSHIQPIRIFVGHTSDVTCVAFHPNSEYVATGSDDRSVRIWENRSGNCKRILLGHQGSVSKVAFSPRGNILASAGWDNTVRVWDILAGSQIAVLHGHGAPVYTLDFSLDGSLLVSGGSDNSVCVWDAAKFSELLVERPQDADVDVVMKDTGSDTAGIDSEDASNSAPPQAPSPFLLTQWFTKNTPVFSLKFTARNILLGSGPFFSEKQQQSS